MLTHLSIVCLFEIASSCYGLVIQLLDTNYPVSVLFILRFEFKRVLKKFTKPKFGEFKEKIKHY